VRVGLNGEPVGVVSERDAAHAAVTTQRKAAAKATKLTAAQQSRLAPRPMPKRVSLSDLKAAAQRRKTATGAHA
jgi:sRNA-binding protein